VIDIDVIGMRLEIDASLARARIPVPRVWREDAPIARLEWTRDAIAESPPLTGCLDSFIRLADASDERIEAFAQRWGILGICEHGQPGMHDGCMPLCFNDRFWEAEAEKAARQWREHVAKQPGYWEPLSAWRYYARQFGAFLSIVADLKAGEDTETADWATIHNVLPVGKRGPDWDALFNYPADLMDPKTWTGPIKFPGRDKFRPNAVAGQQKLIAQWITYMFRDAALAPRLVWLDEAPRLLLELTSPFVKQSRSMPWPWPRNSLYSVLVCQLAAAATSDVGAVRCAICKLPTTLPPEKHRPRHDKRFLCSDDCRAEAHRQVNAASARRRYAARRGGDAGGKP
jgi:hypothetical protein